MTNLWLAFSLPRLALDALLTERHEQALAVVDQRQRIICLNDAAQQAGLQTGLLLSSAQAICPQLRGLPRQCAAESAALQSLACWAWQFSCRIHLEPPDELVLEVGGSLRLFHGLQNFLTTLRQALQQLHYQVHYGLAPTPRGAQLLAREGREQVFTELPPFLAYCEQLPIQFMRWPDKVTHKLRAIGVQKLGPCQALPRDGFIKRYGADARRELDQIWGAVADPRPAFEPPQDFDRGLDLLSETENLQHLMPGFERLFIALRQQLQSCGQALTQIDIRLQHGSCSATRIVLQLQRPSRDETHWLTLLTHRFERLQLPQAVRAITVKAQDFVRLGHQQEQLWAEADDRETRRLIEELSARLGAQHLLALSSQSNHCPEQAWKREEPGRGDNVAPQSRLRPLWLLPQAIPICVDHLRDFEGPERIESGWWDRHCQRDYYRAHDTSGRMIWVYREHQAPNRWFLHGFFA